MADKPQLDPTSQTQSNNQATHSQSFSTSDPSQQAELSTQLPTKIAIAVGVVALHVGAVVGLSNMPSVPLKKPEPPKPIEVQFIDDVVEMAELSVEVPVEQASEPTVKPIEPSVEPAPEAPKPEPLKPEPKPEPEPIIKPKVEPKPEPVVKPKVEPEPVVAPKSKEKIQKVIETQPIDDKPSAWEIQQEQERRQREADEKARQQREADEKARLQREAEEQARLQREADEKARQQREADERAKREREAQNQAMEQARRQQEADEKARREREAAAQNPVALSQGQIKWKSKPKTDVPKSITKTLEKGETLTALLNIGINEKGKITEVNLAQSSGNADFDKLVQKQIRTGRLHPHTVNKVAVTSTATVPMTYTHK